MCFLYENLCNLHKFYNFHFGLNLGVDIPGLLYQRRLTIFNEMFYSMVLRAYFKLNESAAFS